MAAHVSPALVPPLSTYLLCHVIRAQGRAAFPFSVLVGLRHVTTFFQWRFSSSCCHVMHRRDWAFLRLRGLHLGRQEFVGGNGFESAARVYLLCWARCPAGIRPPIEGGRTLSIFCCRRRRKRPYCVPRSCKSSPGLALERPSSLVPKTFLGVEPAGLSRPEPPKTGKELVGILQLSHPFGSWTDSPTQMKPHCRAPRRSLKEAGWLGTFSQGALGLIREGTGDRVPS